MPPIPEPPNPEINSPGVVIIDGERIEFFKKDGNLLSQLRRSSLGTGPASISGVGTKVIDQSFYQDIPGTSENTLVLPQQLPLLTLLIV